MSRLCRLVASLTVAAVLAQITVAPAAVMIRPHTIVGPRPIAKLAAERVIVSFSLSRTQRTFTYQFTAPAAATYTAAAHWEARDHMRVTVRPPTGSPETRTGRAPVGVPFEGEKDGKYTIVVGPAQGSITTEGELAILVGTGDTARKRMPPKPSAEGLASALGKMEQKDAILPLVVRLMERHLERTPNRNDIDRQFEAALRDHPRVSRQMLSQFVGDFHAVPEKIKQRAFVPQALRAPRLAPVTPTVVRAAVMEARPTLQLSQAAVVHGVVQRAPALRDLSPAPTPEPYESGHTLTIMGANFSAELAQNRVEFWRTDEPPPPPGPLPVGYSTPYEGDAAQLTFHIPPTLNSGSYFIRVRTLDTNRASNYRRIEVHEPEAPPPPRPVITSISPTGGEPGDDITIYGRNFEPGQMHKLYWTRTDADGIEGALLSDHRAESTSVIHADVPFIALPGAWGVKVLITGSHAGWSESFSYQIATPSYRITFDTMKCLDESNPEWWGADEIVTFWAVVADESVWKKNTGEYGGFDDGDIKEYRSRDRRVFPADASWGQVQHGIVLVTKLYEWDAGDVDAVEDFVGLLTDVAAGLTLAATGGGVIGAAVIEALGWLLGEIIGAVVGWFGGDPDHLGTEEISWTSNSLQQTLEPQESISGSLFFRNDGDTGSYRLNYTIARQ